MRELIAWGMAAALLGGLAGSVGTAGQADGGPGQASAAGSTSHAPAAPRKLDAGGIENLYRLSASLYSGGQPEGDAGFAALKRLGVRTIISVDGARPDVERARRFGMRYVHLPVGYDGVPREQAVRLVGAVRSLPGPVFIHCHHGKHRGPTAAALCGQALEGWSRGQARDWLERAGTDPNYRGLFATVERFDPPWREELDRLGPRDLPERADVPDLVAAMVEIDRHWDRMKAVRKSGFRPPPGNPDLDPRHEALMLAEQFREVSRRGETRSRGEEFGRMMGDSSSRAAALGEALRVPGATNEPSARAAAEQAFLAVEKSCTACHARYRDR